MFGFDYAAGNSSIFAGNKSIEIMKSKGRGKYGHIAVGTNTLPRAIAYFKNKGIAFAEDTITDKAAYFADEIAGFTIHLVQK